MFVGIFVLVFTAFGQFLFYWLTFVMIWTYCIVYSYIVLYSFILCILFYFILL